MPRADEESYTSPNCAGGRARRPSARSCAVNLINLVANDARFPKERLTEQRYARPIPLLPSFCNACWGLDLGPVAQTDGAAVS